MAKYDKELRSRRVQGDFTEELLMEDEDSRNTILGHSVDMACTSREQNVEERINKEERMYENLVRD